MEEISDIVILGEKSIFQCEVCLRTFTERHLLKEHAFTHAKTKTLDLISYESELQDADEIGNIDNECSKRSFKKGDILNEHAHYDYVKKNSGDSVHLAYNVKKVSTKKLQCNICQKRFKDLTSLKVHTFIHTGERPHACDKCGKTFNQKNNLTRHLLSHTGERRYSCDICQKKFAYKQHYQKHLCSHSGEKPFTCERCGKGFIQKHYLEEHMLTHHFEKPFSCDICIMSFELKESLDRHMLAHTESRIQVCMVCKTCFKTKLDLQRHMTYHAIENSLGCDDLDREFENKQLEHDSNEKNNSECVDCPKDSDSESGFPEDVQNPEKGPEINLLTEDLSGDMLEGATEYIIPDTCFECKVCQKMFKQKHILNKHIAVNHTTMKKSVFSCELPQQQELIGGNNLGSVVGEYVKKNSESSFNRELPQLEHPSGRNNLEDLSKECAQKKSDSVFNCKLSKQELSGRSNLDYIAEECAEKKLELDFKSELVQQESSGRSNLNCLTKEYARKKSESIFDCKLVKQEPSSGNIVEECVQKPQYQCEKCKQVFMEYHLLKEHARIHRGRKENMYFIKIDKTSGYDALGNESADAVELEANSKKQIRKPSYQFQCIVCQKILKDNRNLKDHERTHTGEKPHACPICNERFIQKSNLRRHMLIHTGERRFTCDFCFKKFTYKHHFQAHIYTHTGVRPYVCTLCGKSFVRDQYLSSHMQTHMPFPTYVCKVCNHSYRCKRSFKKHMATHN